MESCGRREGLESPREGIGYKICQDLELEPKLKARNSSIVCTQEALGKEELTPAADSMIIIRRIAHDQLFGRMPRTLYHVFPHVFLPTISV